MLKQFQIKNQLKQLTPHTSHAHLPISHIQPSQVSHLVGFSYFYSKDHSPTINLKKIILPDLKYPKINYIIVLTIHD